MDRATPVDATVDEDRTTWLEPAGDLSSYPPDSDLQQAAVMAVAGRDGFNWGYDPWHYTVPEGSYAADPDGGSRGLPPSSVVNTCRGCDSAASSRWRLVVVERVIERGEFVASTASSGCIQSHD